MFGELYEHQRDALIQPCFYWVKKTTYEENDQAVREIVDVFYEWRDAQADADGMVLINQNVLAEMGGLLGFGQKIDRVKQPVADRTPLEVAGPLIHDDIDLAFKIWGDRFTPFEALLTRRGTLTVFSLIGIYSKNTASTSSLISLNRFLTESLIGILEETTKYASKAFEKERKGRQQLETSRAKAIEAKRIGALERRRRAREEAIRFFKRKPHAKLSEVAQEIAAADPGLGTPGSVQKLITGTQAEALKLLAQ